jgi:hypothetical protein
VCKLQRSSISSNTLNGVLVRCAQDYIKSSVAAAAAAIVGGVGRCRLQHSSITSNKLNGVLAWICVTCYLLSLLLFTVAAAAAGAGGVGVCKLQRSSISSNTLNGVLVRDGAELAMDECSVMGNGGYGVQLQVRLRSH